MDVLNSKQTKQYDYVSRYYRFPFYYNSIDNKWVYGVTNQLNNKTEYVAHKVTPTDTLDNLALKYYGRPDYYWIIADFNRIQDPYIDLKLKFDVINIPSLSSIGYEVN